MAEDAVDAAIKSGKLSPANGSLTKNLQLVGGEGWDPASFTVLAQQYIRMKKTHGGKVVPGVMDTAAAKHLSHAYGTLAQRVATIAQVHPCLLLFMCYCYKYLQQCFVWFTECTYNIVDILRRLTTNNSLVYPDGRQLQFTRTKANQLLSAILIVV